MTDNAERAILGAILLSNGRALDDLDDFDPADYRDARYETLHRLILGMHHQRQPIDAVNVAPRLLGTPAPVPGLTPLDLADMVAGTPTATNIAHYAHIITAQAKRRRMQAAGVKLQQLSAAEGDIDELAEQARAEVDRIAGTGTGHTVTAAEAMDETMQDLEANISALPSAWIDLDHLIGGWRPGALYVIGARPGQGKSVVGLQAALAIARTGAGVAFNSLEMSRSELILRLIAQTGRVDLTRLTRPDTLTDDDWIAISDIRGKVNTLPLHIDDRGGIRPVDIRSHARTVARRGPLGGIVVDYLQLMTTPRGREKAPRHEVVGEFSRYLKLLAKELHCPVIALSQLNRASEGRADKRPLMSDLRESGAVEQDADVILLLHRDQDDDDTRLDVSVAKNRHGPTGTFSLTWQGHYARAVAQVWTPSRVLAS